MQALSVFGFLDARRQGPVIDVRSPSEYDMGHIPGAVSVPLFSDFERSEVGTLYKQQGPEQAMLRGLEFVGPKMANLVRKANELCQQGNKSVSVYCWRGGARSRSVAWLLETAGFKVTTLQHGYKAFRNFVLEVFNQKRRVIVLGGRTGAGKTTMLYKLKDAGVAIIDLESLVCHKGSAFGLLGERDQPSQQQFENNLAIALQSIPPEQPVIVEDESRIIGRLPLPQGFWLQMRSSPLIYMDVEQEERIDNLMVDYGHFTKENLYPCLEKIKQRLGGVQFKQAQEALEKGDYRNVALLALTYYDKAYDYGLKKRENLNMMVTKAKDIDKRLGDLLNFIDTLSLQG